MSIVHWGWRGWNWGALLLVVLGGGCAVGPHTIQPSSIGYNRVLHDTTEVELLLNLVRARYGEQPTFVEVANVTQQYDFTGQSTLQGMPTSVVFPNFAFFPGFSLMGTTAERPTIVLAPRYDEQFHKRLEAPISIDSISILVWSGWNIDSVLRVSSNNLNGLDNALAAGRGHPEWPVSVDQFRHVTSLLRELQLRGMVEIVAQLEEEDDIELSEVSVEDVTGAHEKGYEIKHSKDGEKILLKPAEKKMFVARFAQEAVGSPEHTAIMQALHLNESKPWYEIKPAVEGVLKETGPRKDVTLSRRSFLEAMFFLSQAINVPEEHLQCGMVYQTRDGVGCPFDWNTVTGDLLQVHVQKKRPKCAEVAVRYRDYWFYIDERDLSSRYTLNLMVELYNMEVRGGGGVNVPLITIGARGG